MSAMGYFRRFDAIRFYVGYHSDRDSAVVQVLDTTYEEGLVTRLNSILCQEQRFQLLLAVLSKIFYTDRTFPIF